jgi:hypothetical protein
VLTLEGCHTNKRLSKTGSENKMYIVHTSACALAASLASFGGRDRGCSAKPRNREFKLRGGLGG